MSMVTAETRRSIQIGTGKMRRGDWIPWMTARLSFSCSPRILMLCGLLFILVGRGKGQVGIRLLLRKGGRCGRSSAVLSILKKSRLAWPLSISRRHADAVIWEECIAARFDKDGREGNLYQGILASQLIVMDRGLASFDLSLRDYVRSDLYYKVGPSVQFAVDTFLVKCLER